jgi:AcrR family transcriptional regulator
VRFADDGFNGAALSAIASDAGLSLAALYHYFPNKNALFERVYIETLESGWNPWIEQLEALDPSLGLAAKLRAVGSPGDGLDESIGAFFTPAHIYARRVPELRHLLEERTRYRLRAFRLLVGSLAEEGRIRGARSTGEGVRMLEVLHSGWAFETSIEPTHAEEFFASVLLIADAISIDG